MRGAGPGYVAFRSATMADRDAILCLPGLGGSTRRLLDRDLAGELPRHAVVAVEVARSVDVVTAAEVVGFAVATRQPDEVHLLDVAVLPSWRRRGVAGGMVAWLAARARDDGATAMTLEVRVSNTAGHALYRRLGFTDEGVRPGYYRDGEDAAIMWHHDLAGLAGAAGADDPAPSPLAPPPTLPSTTPTTRTA